MSKPKLFNIHIDWLSGDDDHNAIESKLIAANSRGEAEALGRSMATDWNIDRAFYGGLPELEEGDKYYSLYRKVEDGARLTEADLEELMEASIYYSDACHRFNAAVEVNIIREGDRYFKVETREISKEDALKYTTLMEET